MDLEVLHFFQNVRLSLPGEISDTFELITILGERHVLVLIIAVIYWAISKHAGQFVFFSLGVASWITQLSKNLACVYRPYVRDTSLVPYAVQKSYSFPSGHTTGGTSAYLAFAWLLRRIALPASIFLIVFAFFIGISRLYLTVHTPQDVFIGFIIGIAGVASAYFFFKWIKKCDTENPGHNNDIFACIIVIVVCIITLLIVGLKPYPLDYVDGKLLVEPVKMWGGAFQACGIISAFMIGWVLERRFVKFKVNGVSGMVRLARVVVGGGILVAYYFLVSPFIKTLMPSYWSSFVIYFVGVFFAIFIFPWIFTKVEGAMKK